MHFSSVVCIDGNSQQDSSAVALACRLLREESVIALPTDTIYGLAASAQSISAVRKLYKIKGRDSAKPVAVCVGEVEDVSLWGSTDFLPDGLLKALLPGPVTVVLERTHHLNKELNPSCVKIGIRVPDHPFVRKIVQTIKTPIALTSANFSNEPSSLSPKEFQPLWPQLAAVFDGGCIKCVQPASRAGSTVVDLSEKGRFHIVRDGCALVETLSILRSFNLKPCV